MVLDAPLWSNYELVPAKFETLAEFNEFIIDCEDILHHELTSLDYNTFTSFIKFYHEYKQSSANRLIDFMPFYKPAICPSSLSCVGLGLSLIGKLRMANPEIASSIGLVSCAEAVKDAYSYNMRSPNNVKEHVLVSIRFSLQNRPGYVLMDPGYHIGKVIIGKVNFIIFNYK